METALEGGEGKKFDVEGGGGGGGGGYRSKTCRKVEGGRLFRIHELPGSNLWLFLQITFLLYIHTLQLQMYLNKYVYNYNW